MRCPARATALLAAAVLGGCGMVDFYREETAGISPRELLPLYFQEKQYVTDRELESKVRGALAAKGMGDVEVDVYLKEVTLRGSAEAVEVARAVHGVRSVRTE